MKKLVLATILSAGVLSAACSTTNAPGQPSVTFTSPLASGPANGTSYKFKAQPVTLVITNAVRPEGVPATYSIEVASDPAFNSKAFTQSDIAEGSGTTTTVTVSNLLASSGDVTYFWRSWATVDGVAGPMSATQSFVVQQQVIVNAPALSEPASGITTSELRPTFVTRNATRQGAVGVIRYLFQISKTTDFSTIEVDATVAEQAGGNTEWTPSKDLPAGTLFWRVQAKDEANDEVSPFSAPLSFVVEPFDPKKAVFWNTFGDIANWDQTAKITSVDYTGGYILIDFDRREGAGAWPEVASAGFGPLQYTAGLCFLISETWNCSAPVQFWAGRELEAGGPWRDVAENWFYDPRRWGPMAGYQPECGERVAVWVGQGNLRGDDGNTINQRSNFAIVTWCMPYQAPD